jgi:murein L,D-transpeptidase YcbB/YkuD
MFRANRQIPDKEIDRRDLVEALAAPCEDRLATLLLNVKRWRVSAWNGESAYVEVNIAAQELRYVRDGIEAARERTIVGSTRWYFDKDLDRRLNVLATPILKDLISRIVVNPHWTVPPRIARNEIDREIAKDPSYLERNNMEVIEVGGRRMYRQRPGEDNALGLIKILFPNRESVYLHDTPKKGAFRRAVRALSHGCVRVDNAVDLGIALLSHDATRQGEDFDAWGVRSRLGGEPLIYNLTTPIPIFLEYYTASVTDDGAVRFHPDIYAYDASALAAR